MKAIVGENEDEFTKNSFHPINSMKDVFTEENFKILIEDSPYAIVIHDGYILKYVNFAAVKLFNYDCKEELIGKELKHLIYSNDWDLTEKRIHAVLEINSYTPPRECRIITSDNRIIFTEVAAGPCFYNNKKVIQAILKDISARKEIEKVLKEREQRLKDLTEATFEGIGFLENGIIIDINQQFSAMLHTKQENIIGKHLFDFVADESLELISKKLGSHFESSFEIFLRKIDGSVFPVEVRAKKEKIDGKFILVTVFRDISERKQMQSQIVKAIIEAEERERNRFSTELHDGIGPMLTTLKVYFDWLADTPHGKKHDKIAEKGRQYFNEAIQTLEEISNRLSPRKVTKLGLIIPLKDFISRLNEMNKIKIDFHSNITQRFQNDIEIALYKIINELINNTLKHAAASNIYIDLQFEKKLNKLILNYEDNGKGCVLNEVLSNNKGLGLTNINQRVQSLNGKININSEINSGFKVCIEINITLPQ